MRSRKLWTALAGLGALASVGIMTAGPAAANTEWGWYGSRTACLSDGVARFGTGTPWECNPVYTSTYQYALWTTSRFVDRGNPISYPAGSYDDLTSCSMALISANSRNIRANCVANGAKYTLLIAYPGS